MSGERRIVYILGAGASYGAGATAKVQGGGKAKIPIQATFWETFLRLSKNARNKKDIENFLFRYFLNYRRAPARLNSRERRRQLQPINVEEVFTFLSERNNAPGVASQLRARTKVIWRALIREIGQVFRRFEPNKATRRVYRRFRKQHLRTRDTVVSFNYDVIFEKSLAANVGWYYEGIDLVHAAQSLRVLKPHGSINWEEISGEVKHRKRISQFPDSPIIIAPTHLKFVGMGGVEVDDGENDLAIGYLNQSEQIARVWAAMERELREAKAWVFIGYSFPPSDLYFASILRSTLAARLIDPSIVIVNPDSMAIRQRVQERFAIPFDRIRTFPDIQTFNQVTRSQILRMFEEQ